MMSPSLFGDSSRSSTHVLVVGSSCKQCSFIALVQLARAQRGKISSSVLLPENPKLILCELKGVCIASTSTRCILYGHSAKVLAGTHKQCPGLFSCAGVATVEWRHRASVQIQIQVW